MVFFRNILSDIIERTLANIQDRDYLHIVIQSEQLETPISILFIRRDNWDIDRLMARIQDIVQSAKEWLLSGNFTITVYHVAMPEGGSNRFQPRDKHIAFELEAWLKRKRSVVLAKNGIQLKIFSLDHGYSFIYKGTPGRQTLYLLYYTNNGQGHFGALLSMSGFWNHGYYCEYCEAPYTVRHYHGCKNTCKNVKEDSLFVKVMQNHIAAKTVLNCLQITAVFKPTKTTIHVEISSSAQNAKLTTLNLKEKTS